MKNMTYLVPGSESVLSGLMTETGMKARFGDPEKLPSAKARIAELSSLVRGNTEKIAALAKDETRTTVQKHIVAKDLAERTAQAIRTVATELKAKSEDLIYDGHRMAEDELGPRSGYEFLDSELRGWVSEKVKSPEGMAEVSQLAKTERGRPSARVPNLPHGPACHGHGGLVASGQGCRLSAYA